MSVLEQAKLLGEALAKDETVLKLQAAKQSYENDTELRAAMQEYNALRAALGEEFRKDPKEQNEAFVQTVKQRTDELYEIVTKHEAYTAFMDAQKALNKLMSEVNSEISFYAFGERPCTHDCSSCGQNCGGK